MISKELEMVVKDAIKLASEGSHAYISVEHLLHAMLSHKSGYQIIAGLGGSVDELIKELDQHLEGVEKQESDTEQPVQTLAFQRTLHRAFMHVQSAEKKEVEVKDVFIALFEESESHAIYFIRKQGIERLDVLRMVAHGDMGEAVGMEPGMENLSGEEKQSKEEALLEMFTEDYNALAREGKFDAFIGRETELQRTIEILCRRVKNNPIHVGDPGVGKTAIVQGLASRIVAGKVPDKIKELQIYSLDLGGMIAGTRFRGDFEERLKGVIKALGKKDNVVLYIDEIHTIVGAGATSGSSLNAANILKPVISSGELKCIGATTYEEYRNHFEKDRALARRFQKIDVAEPDVPTTVKILKGLQKLYEDFHGVKYKQTAIYAAAELADKYINEKKLPDKAIDVMDEAGANASVYFPVKKYINVKDVEKIVAKIARIPVKSMTQVEKDNLKDLEAQLKGVIFSQDHAISKLVTAVKRNRAGLGNPESPVGSFLFSGPTGVGKTELCRSLAKFMGIELIRFDMSEYMEKHTVSRLVGAPAGYVGFEQGGLLTEAIQKHPNCVLLLDEIEKAHQDIYNVLLQIMDHATLTDNTGRKADFRNVILVMTSNIGSREMSSTAIGFQGEDARRAATPEKAIERHFAPEFRNRLDDILVFGFLDQPTILKIVDKFMGQLRALLEPKKVELILTEKAREYLGEKGYDPAYGARPMNRIIQDQIKTPLVDEILFGRLLGGGKVTVDYRDDELKFEYA